MYKTEDDFDVNYKEEYYVIHRNPYGCSIETIRIVDIEECNYTQGRFDDPELKRYWGVIGTYTPVYTKNTTLVVRYEVKDKDEYKSGYRKTQHFAQNLHDIFKKEDVAKEYCIECNKECLEDIENQIEKIQNKYELDMGILQEYKTKLEGYINV